MKKICLAIPTKHEVEKQVLDISKKLKINTIITGIATPLTLFRLNNCILNNKPDFIIFAGIAGAFNKNLKLGEVVQVISDVFADLIVLSNQKKLLYINNLNKSYTVLNNKQNSSLTKSLISDLNLKKVKGITVNSLYKTKTLNSFFKKNFYPDIETMENAVVFFLCKKYSIPFLSIRAISNYVNQPKNKWEIKKATNNLSQILINILNKLEKITNEQ